jgi:site-specific DNA-methyltransferase (adenine-specific)
MLPEPVRIGTVTLYNCNNLDLLGSLPDKSFDLDLDDPPYGLKGKWISTGKGGFTLKPEEVAKMNQWDSIPSDEWFLEIKRVSKNQIIWGGNYMLDKLGSCRGPIIWNKMMHGFTLADGEMCWSSFDKPLRIIDCGMSIRFADKKNIGGRWHGNLKPLFLYKKVLQMYAKPGWKILDTHLGSGTHAMACLDLGYELTACEIDKEYFDEAVKRIKEYLSSHEKIFTDSPKIKLVEEGIF